MLFATPKPTAEVSARLAELDGLRSRLGDQSAAPSPWIGRLRREAMATAAESSLSIEGFEVAREDALAAVADRGSGSGEGGSSAEDEGRAAVECYARAMDHVAVMAADPSFRWSDRVILDLHFDACQFQRDQAPGRWRDGPIAVTAADGSGGLAYRGPDAEDVPELMAEVVEWLERGDLDQHTVVRAAMAHLHVVSVHPFRDGNGRIARIVQSLVLARDGIVSAELGSIEEHLAQHTPAYYGALQQAQGGRYQPQRDAAGWVSFCLDAHLAQARRRLEQLEQAATRWHSLERLASKRSWPDRLVIAMEQGLVGGTDRRRYADEADVSPATASADLRRLSDAGLLDQRGRGRSTSYVASDELHRLATGDDGPGD